MAQALYLLRFPGFASDAGSSISRFKALVALGFACGVAAGLLHARMVGLI